MSTTDATRSARLHTAVRVTATLSLLSLVWQFVTAGALLGAGAPEDLHGGGAIVLHVLTGLLALATVAHRLLAAGPTRGRTWPAVVSVLVFAASFVQAEFGDTSTLAVHVPGALVLTVGVVWVTAYAWRSGTEVTRR